MRLMTLMAACLTIAAPGCKRTHPRDSPLAEAANAATHDSELSAPHPILHVASLRDSQRYYRDALGFHVEWEHGDPPDFGAVSRGDSVLFLCQGCSSARGAWTMMFTGDVDRLHAELVGRHAIIKMPPTDMPWGLREIQVVDPDSNVMRFGSAIKK
jgi:catechol 2,3-dioxygenase-like lactoylglutathione lyase family enzyme